MANSTSVYGVKYFLRGRQIADTHEPPYKFTEVFLNKLTDGLAHPGWSINENRELEHNCDEGCGIECCIVMGRPYTNSVMDAVTCERRMGMAFILREFEYKISEFYGTQLMLATLAMDAWLCANVREIDNVVLCLELKQ